MKILNSKALVIFACLSLSTIAVADPAVIITGFGCGLFDGNGSPTSTTNSRNVATQSENSNVILKCSAEVTPPNTGKAAHFDNVSTGSLCGAFNASGGFVTTSDWHEVVSASGEATLICKFKI